MKKLVFGVAFMFVGSMAIGMDAPPLTGCRAKLEAVNIMLRDALAAKDTKIWVKLARFGRGFRKETVAREMRNGRDRLAQLEDAMIDEDTPLAISIAQEMADGVISLYKRHEVVVRAVNQLDAIRAEIAGGGETVAPEFVADLQGTLKDFMKDSEARDKAEIGALIEALGSKAPSKTVILQRLDVIANWFSGYERVVAKKIGRDFPEYEMVWNYISSDFDGRKTANASRPQTKDEANGVVPEVHEEGVPAFAPAALAAAEPPPQQAAVADASYERRKNVWTEQAKKIREVLGWTAHKEEQFPGFAKGNPDPAAIRQLFEKNVEARMAHLKRNAWIELRAAGKQLLMDMTVVRPIAEGLLVVLKNRGQGLGAYIDALVFSGERANIVTDIREIADSDDPMEIKVSRMLKRAADPDTGPTFLHLFAADGELTSMTVWAAAMKLAAEDARFARSKGVLDLAQAAAIKSGPISIRSVQISPSKVIGLAIGIPLWIKLGPLLWKGLAYYLFTGNVHLSQDELEKKLKEAQAELAKLQGNGAVGPGGTPTDAKPAEQNPPPPPPKPN